MTEQKKGWFQRLTDGLSRSSKQMGEQVVATFTKEPLTQERLDALEEMLIEADLGPHSAARITKAFAEEKFGKQADEAEIREALAKAIGEELSGRQGSFDPLSGPRPYVVLFIGVNGSGKTTTLGKIAADLNRRGAKVMVVAGDTFRAAAVEQLKVWADRSGATFVSRPTGSDAAGLVYDALEQAKAGGYDVVLVDTAGRLHNKSALMEELRKVVRVLKRDDATIPHSTLLVLDATTGQNAVSQVRVFKEMVDVTGLVVTKLDGSAKGGVVVALAQEFALPVHAVGVGEKAADLRPFEARDFARSLVGLDE
jgi:fused signal recognition particle receptor